MLIALKQRKNVSILYEQRLAKVHAASLDYHGVLFDIETPKSHNQQPTRTIRADLLIGTDGLYSTVRQHLHPKIEPEYTGITGLIAHIPRASVAWPYEDYERNATIQDVPAALFFLPEDANAEIIMVGRQFTDISHSSVTDRIEFEKLQNDKEALCDLFCSRYDEFGPTSQKILDSIKQHQDQIFMWPFMKIPTLPTWYREGDGRVLILGDAAHAIPPSSGQGVNQVLEDVWMLALLLSGYSIETSRVPVLTCDDLLVMLRFWQERRQARIDKICDWTAGVQNVGRMSQAGREALESLQSVKQAAENISKAGSSEADDMAWLYNPCIEDEVRLWFESRDQ